MRPWAKWEDFHAGLYDPFYVAAQAEESRRLLSDPGRFYDAAAEMIREWPNAAIQNLHHMWTGRNAWVGQATCLYVHGAPAAATREAWGSIEHTARDAANRVARQVREEWEETRRGCETLFGL